MKLYTEMSVHAPGDALLVFDGDATRSMNCERQLEHDAAAAHALMRAMEEAQAYWDAGDIRKRAAELMREWGYKEQEVE